MNDIEETYGGCVLTAGIGQNITRQVAIASGKCLELFGFTATQSSF